jgi:hypothetical protein
MSNVDRLGNARILDPDALTPEQKEFINQNLSEQEVEALLDVARKTAEYCKRHHPSFDRTFSFTFYPPPHP